MKKKILSTSIIFACSAFLSMPSLALDVMPKEYGKLTGQFKAMHIIDAKENQYDPSEGTAYLFKMKYVSPKFNGFSVGIAPYINGDLFNETDWTITNPSSQRIARGMFVTNDPSTPQATDQGDAKITLGEAYLNFKGEKFSITAGNQMLKSPLTKINYSLMPNFYQAIDANTTFIENFKIGAGWINKMALGSRSITDWALISEGTNTGGAVGTGARNPRHLQGTFRDIEDIALMGTNNESDGIGTLSIEYTGSKKFNIGAWYQHADEVVNNLYVEGGVKFPVGDYKLILNAQVLDQNDNGNGINAPLLPANQTGTDIDYTLLGLKATLKAKKWMAYLALNSSHGDTAMYNPFGTDPSYTSSIFSRNALREDVDAFKIGFKYNIKKGMFVMLSHADYGKSETSPVKGLGAYVPGNPARPGGTAIPNMGPCITHPTGSCTPSNDATETDIVFVYKPSQVKGLMTKLFYAHRKSEYDNAHAGELEQGHLRFVMNYNF